MNAKYQSELDIGGRETYLFTIYLPFTESDPIMTMSCGGPEESLGKIFVMKQSEMMMMMNV